MMRVLILHAPQVYFEMDLECVQFSGQSHIHTNSDVHCGSMLCVNLFFSKLFCFHDN
jgi:hypothetical protein